MREQILQRYRQLRAVGVHLHHGAMRYVGRRAILEHAQRLGLAFGETLVMDDDEEMAMVFDLALYTAKDGRSRAIDRYAKAISVGADTNDALMLDAMRRARFSLWRIERRHDATGFIVMDVLRAVRNRVNGPIVTSAEFETWLVDEAFEKFGLEGLSFAARLCEPEDFAMTSGVVVPVEAGLIAGVPPSYFRDNRIADPRLATAIYRAWIESQSPEFFDSGDLDTKAPEIEYEQAASAA